MTKNSVGLTKLSAKVWTTCLVVSLAAGGILGMTFRHMVSPSWVLVTTLFGLAIAVVSLGVSNLFQFNEDKHYKGDLQRFVTCLSAFVLGGGIANLGVQ